MLKPDFNKSVMVRLRESQHATLREAAFYLNTSISELIREGTGKLIESKMKEIQRLKAGK
ncbi:MAG: hypothetical protein MRK01_01655 [Candidatus Scalindua sp.]|nr:hypothetical protein [Candidatus Scalindua sp.]